MLVVLRRRLPRMTTFVIVLLAIELMDETVFGVGEAAWPLIRDDLMLTYVQIGILMTLPRIFGSLIEPAFGIYADMGHRRKLILGGGICFTLALLFTGLSHRFGLLLAAFMLFNPSSGAFVSLAQTALMDNDPERHEQNMARWTFAGSVGVVIGPLLLGVAVAVGLGWRGLFLVLAFLSFVLVVVTRHFSFSQGPVESDDDEAIGFRKGLRNALVALRRRDVLRWLILLEFADLMMDVLMGYMALYFVDVVGVSEGQAGIAVAMWTGVGLLGDALLIPLLERVAGLRYLRISAALEFFIFPAFLLAEPLMLKLILLGLLGFFNAGWYSILMGQLYSSMPGQSGTVLAINNVFGLIGSFIPLIVGALAQQFGLHLAIWVMMLGPIALLVGLPRHTSSMQNITSDEQTVGE